MDLIGQTCELSMPGRWGMARRFDVVIRDSFEANEGRSYLLVEHSSDELQPVFYLLTNKYKPDRLDTLEPRKMLVVAIGKQREDVNIHEFSKYQKTEDYFYYFGAGAIQVVDAELENLRRSKAGEGFLDTLKNVVGRFIGLKPPGG